MPASTAHTIEAGEVGSAVCAVAATVFAREGVGVSAESASSSSSSPFSELAGATELPEAEDPVEELLLEVVEDEGVEEDEEDEDEEDLEDEEEFVEGVHWA